MPDYRRDAFVGTARDYAAHRPEPVAEVLDAALEIAGIDGRGRLLIDLGCGPGTLTIPLSPHFERVIAIDREAEMIEVGRERAASSGITNIEWRAGDVEGLDAPSGEADLVVSGNAFHRFDQRRVADLTRQWLRADGWFATIDHQTGILNGDLDWQHELAEIYRSWAAGYVQVTGTGEAARPIEEVLSEAGFVDITERECLVPHRWSIDGVLGLLRSTSYASRHVLGERSAGFEAAVAEALRRRGGYVEESISHRALLGRSPATGR